MENSISYFNFSDIKRLFFDKKYYLIGSFFIFLFSVALFLLSREVKYEAKSSFFEDTEKGQTIGNLKDIVFSDSFSSVSDAFSFFKTIDLNKKLIEKLGMQISVIDERSKLQKFSEIIKKQLRWYFYQIIDDEEFLEFSNVFYDKNVSSYYFIKFLDKKYFKIYDSNNRFLIKKQIFEPVKTRDFCFTITKIPKSYLNQTRIIKIDSLQNTVEDHLNNFEVKRDKNSSNFLLLKIQNENRELSVKVLNTVMDIYYEHLKNESTFNIQNQISYLEKRKAQLENNLFLIMAENEQQVNINVKSKGFINLDSEIQNLLNKREYYQKQSQQVTKELDNLKKIDINNKAFLDETISKIVDEIKRYEEKKQALLVLIDQDLNVNKNLNLAINAPIQSDDFLSSLTIGNEDFFKSKIQKKKLSIVDLETLKDLHFQLDKSKEDLKLEITQLNHILDKIHLRDFQISFVSFFLSPDLLKNAVEFQKKINDEQNYTLKEIEALKEEYEIEKKYIITHLQELLNLKNLNLEILDQKLFSLKKLQVNLVANEISLLSTKVKDLITKSICEKTNEKNLLEKNLLNIKEDLQYLATMLFQENKLNMKAEMTRNIIDSITKLIESKKLDLNLKKINSKPIDLATVTVIPINLFRNSIIIAFLCSFVFFVIYLYISILKGFPLSKETMKILSLDYCGKISFACHGIEVKTLISKDLESLRKIIANISELKHKIITCISANGPNYIHYLAALLAIVGKKILVVETKSEIEEKNGLFSFLEKNLTKLPIQKLQAYDFLPSGEKKYFAFELLKSVKFIEKLQQIKSKYDLILIYSNAKIDSAESRIYLDFSDKVILGIKKETLEDVKLFVNWAEEKNKLSFITY